MRLGVWLWCALGTLVPVGGCAGDYPLPPTLCDDWCDATRGNACGYYDPAGCVATCEQSPIDSPPCRPYVDAIIRCYREHPGAIAAQCTYGPDWVQSPCEAEFETLSLCVSY